MSKGREIRCYDYVNHPYARVRDALTADAPAVFQSATKSAASRAQSVASELRVNIAGIGIANATHLELEWESSNMPSLFPFMKAELAIYPLTGTETQLDFFGLYEPPMGALGKALDAMAGHRIAEVAVHRFINDVAGYLRTSLKN